MERHFKDLKNEIYKLWKKNLVLSNFTKLPKDLIYNDLQSNIIKPAKKLKTWKSNSTKTGRIHDIIRELTPYISWKQTYEEKDVGKSFLEKYGIRFFNLRLYALYFASRSFLFASPLQV